MRIARLGDGIAGLVAAVVLLVFLVVPLGIALVVVDSVEFSLVFHPTAGYLLDLS